MQPLAGHHIRDARAALARPEHRDGRLPQSELADLLGVNRRSVVRWESSGGPAWLRYALAGLLVDCDHVVKALELLRSTDTDAPAGP